MRTVGSAEKTLAPTPLEHVELHIRILENISTQLRRSATNAKIAAVHLVDEVLAALNVNDLTRKKASYVWRFAFSDGHHWNQVRNYVEPNGPILTLARVYIP